MNAYFLAISHEKGYPFLVDVTSTKGILFTEYYFCRGLWAARFCTANIKKLRKENVRNEKRKDPLQQRRA